MLFFFYKQSNGILSLLREKHSNQTHPLEIV